MEFLKQLLAEAKPAAEKAPKKPKGAKFLGAIKYPSFKAGNMFFSQTCSNTIPDSESNAIKEAAKEKELPKPRNKHLNDILVSKRSERHKSETDYDRAKDKRSLHQQLAKASKDE